MGWVYPQYSDFWPWHIWLLGYSVFGTWKSSIYKWKIHLKQTWGLFVWNILSQVWMFLLLSRFENVPIIFFGVFSSCKSSRWIKFHGTWNPPSWIFIRQKIHKVFVLPRHCYQPDFSKNPRSETKIKNETHQDLKHIKKHWDIKHLQVKIAGAWQVCRNLGHGAAHLQWGLWGVPKLRHWGDAFLFPFFGRGDRRNSFLYIFVVISQGSLNYLFWGESNLMQMYGNIEAFPLKTSALFGLVSQNDPCQNPPKVFHKSPLKNGILT